MYVVPLFSWYNAEFDVADPLPGSDASCVIDCTHDVFVCFSLAFGRLSLLAKCLLEESYRASEWLFSSNCAVQVSGYSAAA